jgi:protein-tyrosine phosphatase
VIQLAGRCGHLRSVLDEEGIALTLRTGSEVAVTWAAEASDEQLALASYGQRGTDLLIETPFTSLVGFSRLLAELQAKGYRITVAHPERNSEYQRDPSRVQKLVDAGMLVQINAESLLGRGQGRHAAESLLTAGLVHVIASDGHRAASWRPVTRLAQGVEAAVELVGRDRALWMAEAAQRAIIEGTELPPAPGIIERPRLSRFFGLTRARPPAGGN